MRWLEWGVRALAALVFGSWILIASVHVDDTYAHDHTAGAWLALARYTNEGILYPPLYDGSNFGGTRFMPLQFVLHAGLARLTGEYLVSGKLLAYAGFVVLLALTFVLTQRLARSATVALGLLAAILVTRTGSLAGTAVRGDALPVALQLGGVTLATRSSRGATAGAGCLCALAILSKSSALWATVAIGLWLGVAQRRRLLLFLVWFGSVLGGGLALFELLSDGRMSDNILGFSSAGLGGPISIALDGSQKFVSYGERYADAVWLLVPLALAALVVAFRRRRLTIYHVSFAIALPLIVVEFADTGVSWNHLIDLEILTALLVADLYGASKGRSGAIVRIVVLIGLVWGIGTSFQLRERNDAEDAARELVGRGAVYERRPLANQLASADLFLAEDPYLSVSRGQDPIVLDAFMLLRILRDHGDWESDLVHRIEGRRFTKIVLSRRLDLADRWWRDYHFGPRVVSAIARNYRLDRQIGRYWLYEPEPRRP